MSDTNMQERQMKWEEFKNILLKETTPKANGEK
jgi:hypothetical protein